MELERRSGVSKLELLCAELAALDSNNNQVNSNSHTSNSKSKKKQKQSASQIKNAKKKETRQKARSVEKLEERKENDDEAAQRSDEESSSCSNSVGNLMAEGGIAELEDEEDEEFEEEELNYANDDAESEHKNPADSSNIEPPPASASPFSSSSSSFTSSSSSSTSCKIASTCCECPNNSAAVDTASAFNFNFDLLKTDDLYLDENDGDDGECLITDEEKNEYYANKSLLMNERLHRREILQQKFQMFKLNACNFQLRPRNVS